MRRLFLISVFLTNVVAYSSILAQAPFPKQGQVLAILGANNELATLEINPSNGAPQFDVLFPLGDRDIRAIGLRRTDGLLYGLDPDDFILYQIGSDGVIVELTTLNLEAGLNYESGDITPDGRYFVTTGNQNGQAKSFVRIDLESPDYTIETTTFGGNFQIVDLAVNPYTEIVYGFDEKERQLYEIDLPNNRITRFFPMDDDRGVAGLYFDAFGNLFGYGLRNGNLVGGLYQFDLSDGDEDERSTGGPNVILDLASCPFNIDFENDIDPKIAFPCEEIEFKYTIANLSGVPQSGIDFIANIPDGFSFSSIESNPFGGTLDPGAPFNRVIIRNMTLPMGLNEMVLNIEVGDIESGDFRSDAVILNLPADFGSEKVSDYTRTVRKDDPAPVEVNKIEEDSLFFTRFACIGETLTLDGTEYGATHKWSNGESTPTIAVSGNGTFVLEASSGCQSTFVTYEVTSATCPFTIEVRHETEPDTTLPCSDVIYTFVFENDSGIGYENLTFDYVLPPGLQAIEFLQNPLGGDLAEDFPTNVIKLEKGALGPGLDTMIVLVEVGNIGPGMYGGQARLSGFPLEIGPFRLSDEPATLPVDSTFLQVLGVESDSTYLEIPLCTGASLVLDGSPFGVDYLWDNGSTAATRSVSSPGLYQLTVFDGCDPSFLFFEVIPGKIIDVEASVADELVNLGQSTTLSTTVFNEGDSLMYEWTDPQDTTLTCLDCPNPMARPSETTTYKILVSNEICQDSAFITVEIDDRRRIYAPTAFSPNGDGINDEFFIQSPDYAVLRKFHVYNRWGVRVFGVEDINLENEVVRWNGAFNGQEEGEILDAGPYVWVAEIEFLDRKTEYFSGDVILMR